MSRGPGRIERAIASVFDAEPDNAFTTEELCKRVYCGVNRVKKKHGLLCLGLRDAGRPRPKAPCSAIAMPSRTRCHSG